MNSLILVLAGGLLLAILGTSQATSCNGKCIRKSHQEKCPGTIEIGTCKRKNFLCCVEPVPTDATIAGTIADVAAVVDGNFADGAPDLIEKIEAFANEQEQFVAKQQKNFEEFAKAIDQSIQQNFEEFVDANIETLVDFDAKQQQLDREAEAAIAPHLDAIANEFEATKPKLEAIDQQLAYELEQPIKQQLEEFVNDAKQPFEVFDEQQQLQQQQQKHFEKFVEQQFAKEEVERLEKYFD